jgi:hypothetical protein
VQKSKPLLFSFSVKAAYGNIPASRVGGTLTVLNNNEIYLFGGQCGDRLNELKCLKFDSLAWSTINPIKDHEIPEPRDGHSTSAYKHFLVVYGGAGAFNTVLHTRTCSPLLYLLNTQTLHWKIHKPLGRLADPRRNHAAVIIGCTMLIYGGIGNNNEIFSDIQGIDLETMQWFSPKFTKDTVRPGPRHSFTMTAVYHPAVLKNDSSEIYNLPAIFDEDFNRKNSGVYIFGGMNDTGKVLNDLYLLQPVKKYVKGEKNMLRVFKVEGTGKPPIARHYHSAGLCGRYLVIVGGRNDALYAGSHQSSVNEIAAFNLAAWRWETVETIGSVPAGCWGIACAALGSKLLCFGGMSLTSFATNELWTIETNQDTVEGFETKKKENPIKILVKKNVKFNISLNQ